MKKWIAVVSLLVLMVAEAACSSPQGVMLDTAPLYGKNSHGGLTPILSGGEPIIVSAGTKVEIVGQGHFSSPQGEFDHIEVDLGNYNSLNGWVKATDVETAAKAATVAAIHR